MITVAKDSTGDFTSIQAAVDSIKSTPEIIYIKNGIYNERVEIKLDNVTLKGESAKDTIITNNYYARMIMDDGIKRGTFRSYTFLSMPIISVHLILHLKIHPASDLM